MSKPILRHVANLWTLMEHPWSLDEKLRAFKDAGFDGVCWGGSPELRDGCARHGLIFVGGIAGGEFM
jgi:sugar phosphate isomerase/epimerase